MRVAVIGLGKLGAPMAAVFAFQGHDVTAFDIEPSRSAMLAQGISPVDETGMENMLATCRKRIHPADSIAEAAGEAEIVFLILPTPSLPDGSFSLEFLRAALAELAIVHAARAMPYQVIDVVSTVSPGSMGKLCAEFEGATGRECGPDFGLVYNPEFIALGTVIADMLGPDFVLVGENDRKTGDRMEAFYATIHGAPVRRMTWASAEICKVSLNVALTLRISYANTVSELCENTPGASARGVLSAIGLDRRIGSRYLGSGTAFGGPCFPRDNAAFQAAARAAHSPGWLAVASEAVNKHQTERLVQVVDEHAGPMDAVGILGLSYKTATAVTEESAGMALALELQRRGVRVIAHDPVARPNQCPVTFCPDLPATIMQARVLILTTPWPEFCELPALLFDLGGERVLIDCWGMLAGHDLPNNCKLITLGEGPRDG